MGQETGNPILPNVYTVIHAGNGAGLPTTAEMEEWIDFYDLHNPTLAALNSTDALNVMEKRECAFLIDTSTMQIEWKLCTCTSGNCEPSIVQGLQQLEAALNP